MHIVFAHNQEAVLRIRFAKRSRAIRLPAAGAKEGVHGESAFTCWDVSSTCKAREDAAPELVTEAAGIARARPVMEFILLSASSEFPSFNKTLHPQHFQPNVAGSHDRDAGTNVHVRKALRQLSVQPRHVNKILAILLQKTFAVWEYVTVGHDWLKVASVKQVRVSLLVTGLPIGQMSC
ncbi:hypothetical protein GOODEAATRI_007484 [Goodea atripinnis]|uniref:Uncharacterized protein n=1 Tax=Goodea atripinnis TaxID=208336 RepID=A0ABV0PC66_9TELE